MGLDWIADCDWDLGIPNVGGPARPKQWSLILRGDVCDRRRQVRGVEVTEVSQVRALREVVSSWEVRDTAE